MRATAAISAILLLSLTAAAQIPGLQRSEFYRDPIEWIPGDTLHDSLPEAFASLDAHLRIRVPSHHRLDISLIYNRRDSVNFRCCHLYRDAGPADDRLVAAPIYLSVSEFRNGKEIVTTHDKISRGLNPGSDDYSLKLIRNQGGTIFVVGQNSEVYRRSIPFDSASGDELLWLCGSPAGLVRHTMSAEAIDAPRFSHFADADALDGYLQASTDANEGYWIYFDRDTDGLKFNVSGNYRLATVRSGDGSGYEILYLGGAPAAAREWQPMQIKGYLRPTGFIGHFDLEWFDLHGRKQKRETSADITDGSSLTLYFPLYDSKVRFRKLLQTD